MWLVSGRDGSVNLFKIADGEGRLLQKLTKHRISANDLSVSMRRPHSVLSVGGDGLVKELDIRTDGETSILSTTFNERSRRVQLFSVDEHPLNENMVCVAGEDKHVFIYDRRLASLTSPSVLKYSLDYSVSKSILYFMTLVLIML